MADDTLTPGGQAASLPDRTYRRTTAWFVGVAALGLLACAAVNVLVDPTAQWGSPLGLQPAIVRGDLEVVKRLEQHDAPIEALILGSSHSFSLYADDLAEATGLATVNAASAGGRVETMCAIARYVAAREGWPRLLVIGVDVGTFNGEIDLSITTTPGMREYVPYTVGLRKRVGMRAQAVRSLFEIVTLAASVRSLRKSRDHGADAERQAMLAAEAGEARGMTADQLDRKLVEERVRRRAKNYPDRYEADSLDPRRVQWFRDLVAEALAHDSRVIIYLTPLHPVVDAACRRRSNYEELLFQALGMARDLAASDPRVVAVDCSTIDKFGGRPEWFSDGVHGTRETGRLIIHHCLAKAGWDFGVEGGGAAPTTARGSG